VVDFRLLGAFAELSKGTMGVVMSAQMEHLGSHWTDFNEI